MASAKKTREEGKKKSKEVKSAKREKTEKSSKKQKRNNKISNGNVSEPEVAVIPTTSSSDSHQEGEQETRSKESTNQHKRKKPKKSSKKQELDDDEEEKEDAKSSIFPMSRIKRIMKSQGFDSLITGDAVFLVNKATEKFLQQFCEDAYACCAKDRKKSVSYKHLASVVSKQSRYDFLSEFVPEKLKAEDALAERKLAETGEG